MLKMERLDWSGAERDIRRAIAANPGYATAHQWYCLILSYQGRFEEARREIELAQSLDPLSLIIVVTVALPYYFERNYERAMKQLERARKLDPDFGVLLLYDGAILSATGRYEEAATAYRKLHTINTRVHLLPLLVRAAFLSGDMDQMIDSLEKWCEATSASVEKAAFREALADGGKDELIRRIKQTIGKPWPEAQSGAAVMAALFGTMGDLDHAFDWLEIGVDPLALFMRALAVEPIFDPLRNDPRYPLLLKRLNLPVL
jgi:tetratricopeptide (TPR) repeat protein